MNREVEAQARRWPGLLWSAWPFQEPLKWPRAAGGALAGGGSSLTHAEVIAGSRSSTERAGRGRGPGVRLGPSPLFFCQGAWTNLQVPPGRVP